MTSEADRERAEEEELKQLLKRAYMQGVNDCPDDKHHGRCPSDRDAIDCAEELLEGCMAGLAAARPRWIPVTEALPPHGSTETHLVLVWVVSNKGLGSFGHAETSMLYPNGEWSHIRSEEVVTHWMDLPAAPETEGG